MNMFGGNSSFGQQNKPATGTGFAFGSQGSTPTPAGNFAFGTPNPGTGFTFQTPSTTAQVSKDAAPTQGFTFGGSTSTPASGSGFNFGAATTPASTGLQLGGATSTSSGFGLGTTATTATASSNPGFNFGGGATLGGAGATLGGAGATLGGAGATLGGAGATLGGAGATVGAGATLGGGTPGFQIGGSVAGSSATPNLSSLLGKPATTVSAPTSTFATSSAATTGTAAAMPFGTPQSGASQLLSKPLAPTTSTATTTASSGLGLGGGFKLGGSLGASVPTTTVPALGQPTSSAATGFNFSTPGAAGNFKVAATSSLPTTSTAISTSSVAAPSGAPAKQMNYRQLEEQINKWMLDLEEQERVFLQQATQVNAWDRLLVENGEKIMSLNTDMDKVKIDQQKLDHELDFIRSQQRELEDLLTPLEKSVEQLPSASFQPHADLERENTYQLAENIDAQLKRMLQDLKEIIDHLNTSNTGQDNTDPIQQITKILNAHMDSLQWVDSNSALLGRRVEEISKQMETQRREQERNFRLVYD